MPEVSAHAPVLVGGGQITDRPDVPTAGLDPLALMEAATRRALEDARAGAAALEAIDTIAVVNVLCHNFGDAAGLLAERLGIRPARAINSTVGGNTPQSLVNHLSGELAAGRIGLALITGAEAWKTSRALGRAGSPPAWPTRKASTPLWGDGRNGMSELELRHGMFFPAEIYPLFENAFRAARGLTIAEHRAELAEMCGRFSRVAAENPNAWFREGASGEEIATVTEDNRMIAFPYPKRMNAILDVNQGAALLLASEETATRLGIPRARWVYPWAGVDVTEQWFVQDRRDYHSLPAVQRAGATVLEAAGVSIGDVRHLDLYSCFPIAPRLSAAALGIAKDDPRPLTVTGGLPWFGGPGNSYSTHAIATMMERLRAEPGSVGLVHTLGWFLTKHAIGVYSTERPARGWRKAGGPELQQWVDALPSPEVIATPSGRGTIEAYTVVHGRDGAPEKGFVIGRLEDRRRFVAGLPRERAVLEAMEREEQVGRRGTLAADGSIFAPG
jgi:acetyl-CoA C-acetyltransferase